MSDSFGKVWRLPRGAAALEPWLADARLAPSQPSGFGANGIALDGAGHLYVSTNSDGRLLRIAVGADGAAGAVEEIAVTPALAAPDGLRALDARTLLVAEHGGRLTKIVVDGTSARAEALASDLKGPTSLAVVDGQAWVTEGQLGVLFGLVQGGPSLPFTLRRIALR